MNASRSGRAGRAAPKVQLKSPLEFAARGLLRYPLYIIAAAILASLVAAGAVYLRGAKRYSYLGKLLYSANRSTDPYYTSPAVRDLQLTIAQPPFLKKIHEEYQPPEDFDVFAYKMRFDINGNNAIDVSYTGKTEQQTQQIVDGAMQAFVDEAKAQRKEFLGGYIDDFKERLAETRKEYRQAKDALADSLREYRVQSVDGLEAEISRQRQSLAHYQTMLSQVELQSSLAAAQVGRLTGMQSSEDDTANTAEATEKSEQRLASLDTQMQKMLEEDIRKQQQDRTYDIEIEQAQREYERSRRLYEKRLITAAQFEEAEMDLKKLESQRDNDIRVLQDKLNDVTFRINNRVKRLTETDPSKAIAMLSGITGDLDLSQQTLALLQGTSDGSVTMKKEILDAIGESESRVNELVELQETYGDKISDVRRASDRIGQLEESLVNFQGAYDSEQAEVIIAQPAVKLLDGERNNFAKWAGAGFIGTFGLCLAPLFLGLLAQAVRQRPSRGSVFGLPMLAAVPKPRRAEKNPEAAAAAHQRAAMRIVGTAGDVASMALLGVNDDQTASLADALASVYRSRGRTVEVSNFAQPSTSESADAGVLRIHTAPLYESELESDRAASASEATVLVVGRKSSSAALQRRIAEVNEVGTKLIGVVGDE